MMTVWKKTGETPLQRLDRLRIEKPELEKAVLSYAGRLDPMAEGVMLVLVGEEENRNRLQYLGLEKEYEVSLLFGISTDTHDVLGLVTNTPHSTDISSNTVQELLKKYTGTFVQNYPAYSSRLIYKKLPDVMPKHEVAIKNIELLEMREIAAQDVLAYAKEKISLVNGEFRQESIIKTWREKLGGADLHFAIADIKVVCSAGTYMRQLADDLGKDSGTGAIALSIKRTRVGDHAIKSHSS